MQFNYQKDSGISEVIYGQTFATMLRQQPLTDKQVVFCANQRYYDRYAEKFTQLIPPSSTQDWLIVPNDRYCNRMDYLEELLDSQLRFSKQKPTLYIGLGNEGMMELTSFLHHVSPFKSDVWLVPISLRAFAQSLVVNRQIMWIQKMSPVMAVDQMPAKIFFDHTLADKQTDGKMVDLLSLILCGIVCDSQFLRELYQTYPSAKHLFNQSFAAFIEPLLKFYQEKGEQIQRFTDVFEQAFFKTSNSHLLSDSMKRLISLLLELAWNLEKRELNFNFKNFMLWLYRLGYPLEIPDTISLAEYGQQVIALAQQRPLYPLKTMGTLATTPVIPTEKELAAAFDQYQQLVEKIRGK